jgi:hypothetical protein
VRSCLVCSVVPPALTVQCCPVCSVAPPALTVQCCPVCSVVTPALTVQCCPACSVVPPALTVQCCPVCSVNRAQNKARVHLAIFTAHCSTALQIFPDARSFTACEVEMTRRNNSPLFHHFQVQRAL